MVTATPPGPPADDSGDLEYDLAHEAVSPPGPAGAASTRRTHGPSAEVPTRTDDADGDLGYDLAHDVPGR